MEALVTSFAEALTAHVNSVGNHSYSEILTEFARQVSLTNTVALRSEWDWEDHEPFVNIP